MEMKKLVAGIGVAAMALGVAGVAMPAQEAHADILGVGDDKPVIKKGVVAPIGDGGVGDAAILGDPPLDD